MRLEISVASSIGIQIDIFFPSIGCTFHVVTPFFNVTWISNTSEQSSDFSYASSSTFFNCPQCFQSLGLSLSTSSSRDNPSFSLMPSLGNSIFPTRLSALTPSSEETIRIPLTTRGTSTDKSPSLPRIVVLPMSSAVTTPSFTVATDGLEEDHSGTVDPVALIGDVFTLTLPLQPAYNPG